MFLVQMHLVQGLGWGIGFDLECRKTCYFVFWCTELPAGWKGESRTAALVSFRVAPG